jgi:hypothetical protein
LDASIPEPKEAITMSAPVQQTDDLSVLLDPADKVTLKSGQVILLNRIKSRELFKLMRVVTHGAGDRLMDLRIDPDEDQGVFAMKLMAMLIMAIPDAESETVEFIFSLAKPVGLIERPGTLNKQDKEHNLARWEKLVTDLENPELEDLITIIEAVIVREAPDLMSLGKRLTAMWETVQRVGKGKVPTPPDPTSLSSLATNISDQSSNSSTLSPQSTDGPTTTPSVPSPSVSFVRPPQQLLDEIS